MKEKIMNLLTKNAANPVEGIVNSALSLIRDKTPNADASFIREKIKEGVSISSKRVLNLVGTSVIVSFALMDMQAKGMNKANMVVLAGGIIYSVAMTLITAWKEK